MLGVVSGKIIKPHKILIYGPPGVGKSTLAAHAPKPIFLGAEEGTNNLDVDRVAIPTMTDFYARLKEAREEKVYKSAVVDTIDWMGPVIVKHLLENVPHEKGGKVTSIEGYGFGKGYVYVAEQWENVFRELDLCWNAGMNVILLGHSLIKSFDDPATQQSYKHYDLKMPSNANADINGKLREYVDAVLFMNYITDTSAKDKVRAFGGKERALYTQHDAAFMAKNRYGLPPMIPVTEQNGWVEYDKAVQLTRAVGVSKEAVIALAQRLPAERREKALAQIEAADAAKLAKLYTQLKAIVTEGKDVTPPTPVI